MRTAKRDKKGNECAPKPFRDCEIPDLTTESMIGSRGGRVVPAHGIHNRQQCLREEKPMSATLSRRNLTNSVMFGLAAHLAVFFVPMAAVNAQAMKPIQEPITGNEEL